MKKSVNLAVSSLITLFAVTLHPDEIGTNSTVAFSISMSTNNFIQLSIESKTGLTYRVTSSVNCTNISTWPSLINILGSGEPLQTNILANRSRTFYSYTVVTNHLYGMNFYVNTNNHAAKWTRSNFELDPTNASLMNVIATNAVAMWLTGVEPHVYTDITNRMQKAFDANQIPIFVLYNIPHRDCGSFSSGGAANKDDYTNWILEIVSGLNASVVDVRSNNIVTNLTSVIILEPDALANINCEYLTPESRDERIELLREAIIILKSQTQAKVYVDGGHADWQPVDTMAGLFRKIDLTNADGFSLNVANFQTDSRTITYGSAISKKLNDIHFVIDTSRNGLGPDTNPKDEPLWCNPPGRALGKLPGSATGHPLVDAYLWIKDPSESDGNCRSNAPLAGEFWADYALDLVVKSPYR